jgi:hypothetical protein
MKIVGMEKEGRMKKTELDLNDERFASGRQVPAEIYGREILFSRVSGHWCS